MKRNMTAIVIILIIVLVLVSLVSFTSNRINQVKEKKVMAGFETLMDKKDVTVVEIIKYLDQNIDAVSKENVSKLVIGLERIQQANLPIWQKQFENEDLQREMADSYRKNGWSLADLGSIQNSELKSIVIEAGNNGFKVETAEGFFFPVIDYNFYQKYDNAVTADLAAYFQIMAVESDQTPVKDAALMIGWDEILKRAARQEEFIKEYSSSAQIEAMQQLLKRYVTFVLYGCNNTPLFSYDTKQMIPKAKQAYEKYRWGEESGSFSALLSEYLKVLEENDYRLTNEVDAFRKNVAATF